MAHSSLGGECTALVEEAEALLEYGARAQQVEGDLLAGRRWFEAAYREGERDDDALVMARAVLGLGGLRVHEHRGAAGSGLLQARLRHVGSLVDPASGLALRLRVRAAAEADYGAGRYEAILGVLDEARAAPDLVVRLEALSLAHHCLLGPEHGDVRRALAAELLGEAALRGRRTELLMGVLWQTVDRFLDGDPYALRALTELRALLAEDEHLAIGYVVHAIGVMLAIRDGRLPEAEQLARECLDQGTKAGDPDALAWYSLHLVTIRWYQGRLPELLPTLTELVYSPTVSAVDNSFLAALAMAAATGGDDRTARGALAALRGRGLAELPRSSGWLLTMYGIVEAAHALGNAKAATRAYELLSPYAGLPITASLAVTCFGSVHHALGVAALTSGDTDRAVGHLREAVHRNLALGHWPAVRASRLRLVEALERRGRRDDVAAAQEQRAWVQDGTPAPGRPVVTAATCTRHGRRWRVEVGGRAVLVDQSVGMLHLAVLTANPGVEISAIDLVVGVDALGEAARHSGMPEQPVLDQVAVQRYRRRLAELPDEIADRAAGGDRAGADRARAEQDWLLAELGAATSLNGRPRPFADNKERARIAVGRAIRRSIAGIERADAAVGAHLRASVHTGTRCWYRPAAPA